MKKIIRACIVLLVAHVMGIVNSCCPDQVIRCFNIASLETRPLDNSGLLPLPPQSDSIPAKAFVLELRFPTTQATCMVESRENWSFYASALAFQCDDDILLAMLDSITAIEIISTADFDAEHPQGTELSELFVRPTLGQIAQGLPPSTFPNEPSAFHFLLVKEPETVQAHRFITTVRTLGGHTFRDTTQTIILTL
jgi:hypothetical protein